jgi:hypothetical protein
MKNLMILGVLFLSIFASCKKDETTTPTPSNPDVPNGTFTKTISGTFLDQNGYNAEGTAELGRDASLVNWVHLASDFNASLSTGAVTLYISKNQQLKLGDASSFERIASITKAGEQYFKVNALSADFKYAILWCSSANVQFGNAELK